MARAEAARLGLELDAEAAKALIAQVGERQQRLLRELEKLALEHGAGARDVEEVEESCAELGRAQGLDARRRALAGDARPPRALLLELRQPGRTAARPLY